MADEEEINQFDTRLVEPIVGMKRSQSAEQARIESEMALFLQAQTART